MAGPGGVQSVDRALCILGILARLGHAGVTEIAAELGVHKSTAFRLVTTLETHELVEQTEDRGKYRLGMGLVRLAGASTARLDVVQEARPVCRRLASECGETVNVAVLSDRSALYLDQVAGASALPVAQLGRSAHPAARHLQRQGAAQRAGAAPRSTAGSASLTGLHAAAPSPTGGRCTVSSPTSGSGATPLATDELELGLTAIAAPVRSAHGDVVASMSVSGPTLPAGRRPARGAGRPSLVSAADEVSTRLGWEARSTGPLTPESLTSALDVRMLLR